MTWNELAARYPEFVQWVVATYGPLPDGNVTEEDFNCFKTLYEAHQFDGQSSNEEGGPVGP